MNGYERALQHNMEGGGVITGRRLGRGKKQEAEERLLLWKR